MRKIKITESPSGLFRKKWLKKGWELVNITSLCELKLGDSGWCNDLNEPDETVHHVQVYYRKKQIAVISGGDEKDSDYVIDEDRFIYYNVDGNFIIYMKVKR